MAGAVIGALRVVLGADTAALDKGLKDSQSGMAAFAKGMAQIAGGIGLEKVLEGFVNSAVNAIKHGVELGDQLNKMSQSAGVSVEELSRLKYAAELSDVSMESLGKSLGKLSKALVAAASDGASQAGRAFAAMGVEVKSASDGSIRPSSEVLSDLAEKFSGYKDGAEKTALAIALFGKAGAAMIPLLNQGRDGLKEAGDEAQKFGLVLDKQTTMAAEAFLDNLKRLDAIKQGLYTTIAARLLPTLEQLSEQFLETKKNSTFTADAADFVSASIRVLTSEVALAYGEFKNLATGVIAIKNLLAETAAGTDFGAAAWEKYNAVTDEANKELATLRSSVATLSQNLDSESFVSRFATMSSAIASTTRETQRLRDESAKVAAPIVGETAAAKDALDKYIGSQMKSLAAHQAEIATFGALVGQKEALTVQLQAEAVAKNNDIAISTLQQQQIDLLKQKTSDYALTLAGLQLTQSNLTPAQLFQQEQMKIQALFDAGKLSADAYGQAMDNAAQRANATWGQASASIAGSFAQISGAFSKESSAMATAAKVFGIIQGTISMFTGAAKALELPFPANIAAVAAVLAKGASLVASIKSQSVPTGFKDGLSMTVPGGVGGGDSRMFQAMVEPGERIDITPNRGGGTQNAGRNDSQPATVNISMPIASSRDAFRALIEGLNETIADGYRLNVVPS